MVVVALLSSEVLQAAEVSAITGISVSKTFFNPFLGQKVEISLSLSRPGALTACLIDRDGFPVRTLVRAKPVEKGRYSWEWDGLDDQHEIVPDEAYSLKIDLKTRRRTETYFPANSANQEFFVAPNYYNPRAALLSYNLSEPSRVHIQAGTRALHPNTTDSPGPVLKTLVNGAPRISGAVVEPWDGLDDGGVLRVTDLPNYMITIAATPLPKNAIITVGNQARSFLQATSKRTGRSLLTLERADDRHSAVFQQTAAPTLRLIPQNATWSAAENYWSTHEPNLKISISLAGASATSFGAEPATVLIYIDSAPVLKTSPSPVPLTVEIPIQDLSVGIHTVVANWVGPSKWVASDALRLRINTDRGHKTTSNSPREKNQ